MSTLKKTAWFFKKNRGQYSLVIFFLLLEYLIDPLPPYLIGRIADEVSNQSLTRDILYRLGLILFSSIILRYLISYIWNFLLFKGSYKMGRDSRRRLVEKLLGADPEFYSKNTSGSLMSKATNDVSNMEMLAGYGILSFLDATIYPLVLIFIMGKTISWKLTLISIIPLPILIYASKKLGDRLYQVYRKIQTSLEGLNESVLENVTSIRVIRGFAMEKEVEQRFDKNNQTIYEQMVGQVKLAGWFMPLGAIIPALSFLLALLWGEKLMALGQLSLGQLVSFFVYLNMLVWPMYAFGDFINVYQESKSSIDRLDELYKYEGKNETRKGSLTCSFEENFEFKDFSFSYPQADRSSLRNINLKVSKGQTLGIVGKIGSGKTSLARQFLTIYQGEKGEILIDDRPLTDYSVESVRAKVGYVPQNHILFSKSIYENVLFGQPEASEKELIEALNFSDFTKDLEAFSQGLNTKIGEKGVSISGGQKQRISIARAFIKNPDILILDDSLSAVDGITEEKILANIKAEREGKTNIIIAHRLSGVRDADLIIVMDDGLIVERGSHQELMDLKGWYYQQYNQQKLGDQDD